MLFISGYYYSKFELSRDIRGGVKWALSKNSRKEVDSRGCYTHMRVMLVNDETWAAIGRLLLVKHTPSPLAAFPDVIVMLFTLAR